MAFSTHRSTSSVDTLFNVDVFEFALLDAAAGDCADKSVDKAMAIAVTKLVIRMTDLFMLLNMPKSDSIHNILLHRVICKTNCTAGLGFIWFGTVVPNYNLFLQPIDRLNLLWTRF